MARLIKSIVLGISLCLSSTCLLAGNDVQWWNKVLVTGQLSGSFQYWFESQARFGDNLTRLTQGLVRPGIGYKMDDHHSVWLGYAWIFSSKPFAVPNNEENRIWQQYFYSKRLNHAKFMNRLRLEQRMVEGINKVGWRFREFFKIMQSVSQNDKFYLFASEEYFVRLNNVAINGDNRGFDQNRIIVGLIARFSKAVALEVGYQHQYINRERIKNYRGDNVIVNLTAFYD